MKQKVDIFVYGAEQNCASCVNLPSSKETFSWLQEAIARKFPNQSFNICYIDIFNPPEQLERKQFAKQVIEDDMLYPVVTIGDEVVGEGNPRLKDIYKEMEKYGYHDKK